MTMFFGVILLSAHVLTVSTVNVAPDKDTCAKGEPSPGDLQPLVNLTVLPSLTIIELNRVTVICDAATPSGASSLPPSQIHIYFGEYVVKTCGNGKSPIYQCVYSLNSFFPMLDRIVSCTAVNAVGQCRLKVAIVALVKEEDLTTTVLPTTTIPEKNMTTPITAGNMTTSLPQSTETARNMSSPPPSIKIFKKTSSGERIFMTPFGLVTLVFLAATVTFK